jgi:hypothetical protein
VRLHQINVIPVVKRSVSTMPAQTERIAFHAGNTIARDGFFPMDSNVSKVMSMTTPGSKDDLRFLLSKITGTYPRL